MWKIFEKQNFSRNLRILRKLFTKSCIADFEEIKIKNFLDSRKILIKLKDVLRYIWENFNEVASAHEWRNNWWEQNGAFLLSCCGSTQFWGKLMYVFCDLFHFSVLCATNLTFVDGGRWVNSSIYLPWPQAVRQFWRTSLSVRVTLVLLFKRLTHDYFFPAACLSPWDRHQSCAQVVSDSGQRARHRTKIHLQSFFN